MMKPASTCLTFLLAFLAVSLSSSFEVAAQEQQRLRLPSNTKNLPSVFKITPAGDSAILVNIRTGQSWWLHQDKKKDRPVWLPISRMDDFQNAAEWLATQSNVSDTSSAVDAQLAFAKAELKQLRAEYGSRHPKVIKVASSIRALQKVATKQRKDQSKGDESEKS